MKTCDLSGPALDWAVAKCEQGEFMDKTWWADFGDESCYSTDWSQGGPIIEQEKISVVLDRDRVFDQGEPIERWYATRPMTCDTEYTEYGHTPLIAAMRTYVASKLGDEVEIPEELLCRLTLTVLHLRHMPRVSLLVLVCV
jgi:hypothetical protein